MTFLKYNTWLYQQPFITIIPSPVSTEIKVVEQAPLISPVNKGQTTVLVGLVGFGRGDTLN